MMANKYATTFTGLTGEELTWHVFPTITDMKGVNFPCISTFPV